MAENENRKDNEDAIKKVCLWPLRYTVALLSCIALMNTHAQQSAMTVALSCMLNGSQTIRYGAHRDDSIHSLFVACNQREARDEVMGDWDNLATNNRTQNIDTIFKAGQRNTVEKVRSPVSDTRWTETIQRLLVSSFQCGYILTLLLSGICACRTTGRTLLGYSQLIMSTCTLLTPVAANFMHTYAVVALQFGAGLAAGFTYPCLMAVWRTWAPSRERTILISITFSGIPLAIVLSSSTVHVACYFGPGIGWSALFIMLGLLGIIWFILWMCLVSSRPDQSRWISMSAQKMMTKHTFVNTDSIPWCRILKSRTVWAMITVHTATEWTIHLVTYVLPLYLYDVVHININSFSNGLFSTTPFAAFLLAVLMSGYLSDCLRDGHRTTTVRRIFTAIGANLISSALIAMSFFNCRLWVYSVAMLIGATASLGPLISGCMSSPLDMSPGLSSVLIGLSLTIADTLKLIAMHAVDYFTSMGSGSHEWLIVLYVSVSLLFLSSVIFALFGNDRRPAVDLDSHSSDPPTNSVTVPHDTDIHSFVDTQRASANFARTSFVRTSHSGLMTGASSLKDFTHLADFELSSLNYTSLNRATLGQVQNHSAHDSKVRLGSSQGYVNDTRQREYLGGGSYTEEGCYSGGGFSVGGRVQPRDDKEAVYYSAIGSQPEKRGASTTAINRPTDNVLPQRRFYEVQDERLQLNDSKSSASRPLLGNEVNDLRIQPPALPQSGNRTNVPRREIVSTVV